MDLAVVRIRSVELVAIAGLCLAAVHGHADTTGPQTSSLAVNVDLASGVAWTNPDAGRVSDDTRASVTTSSQSDGLLVSDFGFSIPFGATVTGIQARVERSNTGVVSPDSEILIPILDGAPADGASVGNIGNAWSTTDTVGNAGGDGFTFGREWTPSEINSAGFGMQYELSLTTATTDTFSVDAITVEVFFDPLDELDPCPAFPGINAGYANFVAQLAGGEGDIDGDGLIDAASLALANEVACNPNAPESLADATYNAFNINLVIFDGEEAAESLADFRETLAMMMLISADMEAAIAQLLADGDPPVTLSGDYTQVTCSGDTCMPQAIAGRALAEEFIDFDPRDIRAANEPYSATGDLDNDGTDNLTEFNNVRANGGTTTDFVIAATSPDLDGTEPIRTPGGGGNCFIATAAYGTPLANELDTLRLIRDSWLLRHAAGSAFVDGYYRLSPGVAGVVAESPWARRLVRAGLRPIVELAGHPVGWFAVLAPFAASLGLAGLFVRGYWPWRAGQRR